MSLGGFGDRRLEKGGPIFLRGWSATVARGGRVRRLGGDRAGEIRFTRFLRNPAVTLDGMTGAAVERTQGACAGRDVLAVRDLTVTQSSGGGGSFPHAMIAVDAASGAVLGALDARLMERTDGGKASRRSRGFGDRQNVRWLEARGARPTAAQSSRPRETPGFAHPFHRRRLRAIPAAPSTGARRCVR